MISTTASIISASCGPSEPSADARSDSSSADSESSTSSEIRIPCIRNGELSWTTLPQWRVEELGRKHGGLEVYDIPGSDDDPPED